jgi:hypothetical protein
MGKKEANCHISYVAEQLTTLPFEMNFCVGISTFFMPLYLA